jgi:DNA-binding transcriptional regulator YbjK
MRIPKDTRVFSAPERRRRKILDAALELVGEGGPDAITHRAVAQRARVSLGSTTYHYGAREDLIRAAFRHYLAEVQVLLGAMGAAAPAAQPADVAALAVEVARRSIADPVTARAEYELILFSARDPLLGREFLAYERALEAGLAVVLERLDVRRPHDAARTIIDMVRGFELERFAHAHADPEDLRRRVRTFVDALAPPRQEEDSRIGRRRSKASRRPAATRRRKDGS